MKRTALLLVTAIYLISCMGMSVNRFYCCGKLASISYSLGATENGGQSAKKKRIGAAGTKNKASRLRIVILALLPVL